MTIQWRLTFWFSIILSAIMILSGILLDTFFQHYLYDEVDINLRTYSARVHGTLHSNVNSPLDYNVIHSSLPPLNEFSSPGIYLQLIDLDGKVVVKSDNLGELELPVSTTLIEKGIQNAVDIQTIAAGEGARVRIMVSPMYMQNQTLLLEVAQSLKTLDSVMNRLRFVLIIGIVLATLITVFLGAILVRRTLVPVEKITKTARAIQQSPDLNQRVSYQGPADEIGRLAMTFDSMIESLHKAFESQKNFVADASHELRTPLTIIQGNLDLLKRNISNEDRQESLLAIESETRRLTKITGDLLLLAEIESGHYLSLSLIPLKAIIIEELQRARIAAGNRTIITGKLEELAVKGDMDKIKQVLSNLMDNAIKYTTEGDTIKLSLFREGDWARLEITDTGMGIAPENLPHLFDRFYRVDKARSRSRGGTGLGLSIVKGIVEQHSGRITVTSTEGLGSTFTVWLKL